MGWQMGSSLEKRLSSIPIVGTIILLLNLIILFYFIFVLNLFQLSSLLTGFWGLVVRHGIEEIISFICSFDMNYTVCSGVIRQMSEVVWPQFTYHIIGSRYTCSRVLGFCANPTIKVINSDDYVKRVLSDKPDFIKDNNYVNKQYQRISSNHDKNRKTIKVLHVTDIHLDIEYAEGMNANCGDPICCRKENGIPPNPKDAAGKYGSYKCDLAPTTANLFFEYIANMPEKPDLVFWTGDNIAHDLWQQSVETNTHLTKVLTDAFKAKLPNIPVFPVLGNHEFYPVNVQDFIDGEPVIDAISRMWREWLGEGYLDFKKAGYYNTPLKGTNGDWTGFRVIGLNTEACNDQNWYLFSQNNDPGSHIQWLEEQLKEMEKKNERAFIIGHVIPGTGGCISEWSIRYRALMERYQHLILAHFFGHTHVDDFTIITDTKNTSSIGSIQMPGSLNTNGDKNPAFRIYELDYETRYPVKAHKYYFNLTAANLGNPEFKYMYEQTQEYGLKDLSPASYRKLSEMIKSDSNVATKYIRNTLTQSTPSETSTCTGKCQHNYFCKTSNFFNFERQDCGGKDRIDFKNSLKSSLYESFFTPWIEKTD